LQETLQQENGTRLCPFRRARFRWQQEDSVAASEQRHIPGPQGSLKSILGGLKCDY
jgi:hypothetical protein